MSLRPFCLAISNAFSPSLKLFVTIHNNCFAIDLTTSSTHIVFDIGIAVRLVQHCPHDVQIAVFAGGHECRRAVFVLYVDISRSITQQLHGLLVAVSHGQHECRLTSVWWFYIDIAFAEQPSECVTFEVISDWHNGCKHDWRVAGNVLRVDIAYFCVQ